MLLTIFVLVWNASFSQSSSKISGSRIKSHVEYLASDSLEGRRAGTRGEHLAASYIVDHFKSLDLSTYNGSTSYTQSFEFPDGFMISDDTQCLINDKRLKPIDDFFPLSFSAHHAVMEEEVYVSLKETNHTWFIDIAEILNKTASNPHADLIEDLKISALEAAKKGATGVIFYSSAHNENFPTYNSKFSESISIPVIMLRQFDVIHSAIQSMLPIKLSFHFKLVKKTRRSQNVIGFLNNNKSETIVIGAHYDHLGYGEDGNSMLRTNTTQIHNGADDNASGTSALLELSTLLRQKKYRHFNYLFIAFSAEELGLLGSKFFADHHDLKKLPLKYMINLDMVGRLNDSTKSLTIGGFGTSKDWSTIFSKIKVKDLNIKLDSSGTGPSDHTSFYRKDMPVLFYFTGLHTDYHKPSDDADKINIHGTTKIIDHISNVIKTSKNYSLPFSKTREQQTSTSTRFSVSLGIMPDYSFSGDGVRVDGVSEGKLAQQIGIKASDIIKKLGDVTITSVESYMKALSKFKKGDNTIIEYLRGNELLSQQITFK